MMMMMMMAAGIAMTICFMVDPACFCDDVDNHDNCENWAMGKLPSFWQ